MIHEDDREQVAVQWAEARAQSSARGGEPVHECFTWRMRRADGTFVWLETSACITETHWYNISRDITDQKRLEASLKEFLTSTMADMLQPLTGIQAASQLLLQRRVVQRDADTSFLVSAISSASHMLMGEDAGHTCMLTWR